MTRLTDDREYTQDEGETVDLVIWEEWEEWIKWEIEEDWERWVNGIGWGD